MWPYATATLRGAWRSPLTWCLLACGVFAAWFATEAAVLALDEAGAQTVPLVLSTSQLVGVLLALWLLARALEDDRHAGFARASDAAAPGRAGRLLGRWAGATLAGMALASLTGLTALAALGAGDASSLYMYSTCLMAIPHAAAWGLLLGARWASGGALLAALGLWACGHLPWGEDVFVGGPLGTVLGALLPSPLAAGGLAALGYTSAAVAGLLLLALAFSPSADS